MSDGFCAPPAPGAGLSGRTSSSPKGPAHGPLGEDGRPIAARHTLNPHSFSELRDEFLKKRLSGYALCAPPGRGNTPWIAFAGLAVCNFVFGANSDMGWLESREFGKLNLIAKNPLPETLKTKTKKLEQHFEKSRPRTTHDWLSSDDSIVDEYLKLGLGHSMPAGFWRPFLYFLEDLSHKKTTFKCMESWKKKVLCLMGGDDPIVGGPVQYDGKHPLGEKYFVDTKTQRKHFERTHAGHGQGEACVRVFPRARHDVMHEGKEEMAALLTWFGPIVENAGVKKNGDVIADRDEEGDGAPTDAMGGRWEGAVAPKGQEDGRWEDEGGGPRRREASGQLRTAQRVVVSKL